MSTISSKYIPHKLQSHNTRPVTGDRRTTFPEKSTLAILKSSVCLAESRPETNHEILMHSTKKLDYDKLGDSLLKSKGSMYNDDEKKNVERLIKDMRSKHYELGNDSPITDSLYQKDFTHWDKKHLHENKANIKRLGSDSNSGAQTGYFISQRDRNKWVEEVLPNTNYKTQFCTPYEQIRNNAAQGRELLHDLHHKSLKEREHARENSNHLNNEKELLDRVSKDALEERRSITNDMRRTHFYFGEDPTTDKTTQRATHEYKEREENVATLGGQVMRASSIILGHQSREERMKDYQTVYADQLCGTVKKYDRDTMRGDIKATKESIQQRMAKVSVIYGSGKHEDPLVSHYKGEFRNITFGK